MTRGLGAGGWRWVARVGGVGGSPGMYACAPGIPRELKRVGKVMTGRCLPQKCGYEMGTKKCVSKTHAPLLVLVQLCVGMRSSMIHGFLSRVGFVPAPGVHVIHALGRASRCGG